MGNDNDGAAPPASGGGRVGTTLAGFRLGVWMALPVVPGMVAFGLAVGATAARKGLTFADNLLMNLFVYAGMSQLVALDAWPERFGVATLAGLALLMVIVNARMLLMSASLQPWLGALPRWQMYPALHLLTDPGWLIAMRYRAGGGSDAGVFFGSSVMLALAWMSAAAGGYLAGALVADPRRFGIDLVMPIFFAAMLIPLWRGARRAVAWAVAGAVALLVHYAVGGWWFVVAGAIAGSVAGGFLDDPD
jgi:predicted branched-subunit amino acid permease